MSEMVDPVQVKDDGSIHFNMTEKQKMMVDSNVDEIFWGGAAFGGKTLGTLLFCAMRRMSIPNSQGIIFRRTYPELDKSIIRESFRIFMPLGAKFNSSKRCWVFPNGSIQDFGHCEGEKDVYTYYSSQYHDMCFDEATMFTVFQLRELKTRCRSTIPGVKALVRLTSNPGGVSHGYFYERYIKPSFVNKIWQDPETPEMKRSVTFIQALMEDNPFGMAADPDYGKRLQDLPEKRFLALAKGRWDTFEGAYFENWNPTPGHHVLMQPRRPDTYTFKYISMDWGFAEPAAIYWWEVTPMGRVFCYRELYITRLGARNLARKILEMSPKEEQYEWLVAPPEIWGKTSDYKEGGETISEAMQAEFGDRIGMVKANNDRVAGWLKMREFLGMAPDGRPWTQISPVCPNLIRTIPAMIHDDTRPEDASKNCEDHGPDCLAGDTVIETNLGKKTIAELVGQEGLLWTVGGWKRFSNVREKITSKPRVRVVTDDGRSVICTDDHLFLLDKGWVEAGDLRKGDLVVDVGSPALIPSAICALRFCLQPFRSLAALAIITAGSTFKRRENAYTAWFGNFLMGLFPWVFTFTTKIMTAPTIKSAILNFCPSPTTFLIIPEPTIIGNKCGIWPGNIGTSPSRGTVPQKEKLGTPKTEKTFGKTECLWIKSARSAAAPIKQGIAAFLGSATSTAKCLFTGKPIQGISRHTSVSGVYPTKNNIPVYDLEVDDVHCFAVNGGLVVHNSARYFFMSMTNIPRGEDAAPESGYEKIFGKPHATEHPVIIIPDNGY